MNEHNEAIILNEAFDYAVDGGTLADVACLVRNLADGVGATPFQAEALAQVAIAAYVEAVNA